jgi:hypothetical protein
MQDRDAYSVDIRRADEREPIDDAEFRVQLRRKPFCRSCRDREIRTETERVVQWLHQNGLLREPVPAGPPGVGQVAAPVIGVSAAANPLVCAVCEGALRCMLCGSSCKDMSHWDQCFVDHLPVASAPVAPPRVRQQSVLPGLFESPFPLPDKPTRAIAAYFDAHELHAVSMLGRTHHGDMGPLWHALMQSYWDRLLSRLGTDAELGAERACCFRLDVPKSHDTWQESARHLFPLYWAVDRQILAKDMSKHTYVASARRLLGNFNKAGVHYHVNVAGCYRGIDTPGALVHLRVAHLYLWLHDYIGTPVEQMEVILEQTGKGLRHCAAPLLYVTREPAALLMLRAHVVCTCTHVAVWLTTHRP